MYKYKSGAEKRKQKKQKEEAAAQNSRTLFDVGFVQQNEGDGGDESDDLQESDEFEGDINSALELSVHDEYEGDGDDLHVQDCEGDNVIDSVQENESVDSTCNAARDLTASVPVTAHADIGTRPTSGDVETIIKAGYQPHPKHFPRDVKGSPFPVSILKRREQNGDETNRDWLIWSAAKQALYCLPCRLFKTTASLGRWRVHLSNVDGWSGRVGWKKLYERIPEHERSMTHRQNYLEWREVERRLLCDTGIDLLVEQQIMPYGEKFLRE